MAEAKKKAVQAEAGSKNHSSEILDNLLSKVLLNLDRGTVASKVGIAVGYKSSK